MARVIQVFEFEKLTLHLDWKGRQLLPRELERLLEFNDNNNNLYFTGIRDGIQFNNYVGVIQIGGLTIEILPKADKVKATEVWNTCPKWVLTILANLVPTHMRYFIDRSICLFFAL